MDIARGKFCFRNNKIGKTITHDLRSAIDMVKSTCKTTKEYGQIIAVLFASFAIEAKLDNKSEYYEACKKAFVSAYAAGIVDLANAFEIVDEDIEEETK